MDGKEFRSVVELMRSASSREIGFIVLLIFPFYLGAWAFVLNNLPVTEALTPIVLGVVSVAFFVAVLIMRWWDPPDERFRRAAHHVKNFLEHQAKDFRSFEAIRRLVNEDYTDEFMKKLIDRNPEIFRRARIKREGGPKDGIGLIHEMIDETKPVLPVT